MKSSPYPEALAGSKLLDIKRMCDLVMFSFAAPEKKEIRLHAQCIIRIFDCDGILVICSTNMYDRSPNYRKKRFKRYDWTAAGSTVFDDAINDYKDKLCDTKVVKVKSAADDLFLYFANGMRMEILAAVTKYDDENYSENYRIFDDDEKNDHVV